MLGQRIASQSEVIGAIVSGCSPCGGAVHLLVRQAYETMSAISSASRWRRVRTRVSVQLQQGLFIRDCSSKPRLPWGLQL